MPEKFRGFKGGTAIVLAVGPGAWNLATGVRIPIELEPGDMVAVGGAWISFDEWREHEIALISDNDVLVRYDKEIMARLKEEEDAEKRERFEVVQ